VRNIIEKQKNILCVCWEIIKTKNKKDYTNKKKKKYLELSFVVLYYKNIDKTYKRKLEIR
jgi:hypothetical protein